MSPLNLLAICHDRQSQSWLHGLGGDFLDCLALKQQTLQAGLAQCSQSEASILCIAEANPLEFLASFVAASACATPLLIANPAWGAREWQQVGQMLQPDLVLGLAPPIPEFTDAGVPRLTAASTAIACHLRSLSSAEPLICIPTGGTSGEIRFAIHTLGTLAAAVAGFQRHFQQDQIHSCCVLPLYHVSGLMQFLRSQLTGGDFYYLPWQTMLTGSLPDFPQGKFWLSLVPTQLQRLLGQNPEIFHQFRGIFIGGGPTWPALLDHARRLQIPLALTYGMTETAAQVATLHPQEFLTGHESCGKPLPHVQISLATPQAPSLQPSWGQLCIQGASLALGYVSAQGVERLPETGLLTDDLGYFDAAGYLHVVGRNSSKIITGGENVFPAEVEAAIYGTGYVQEVCVLGVPDQEWGEVVTAVYVPQNPACSPAEIQVAIAGQLSRYKQPKRWYPVLELPRNPQGKVNQAYLRELLSKGCGLRDVAC